MKKYNRAARAARFLAQCFDVVCQTMEWRQRELAAVNLYMKTIRTKQAKVQFAYFVQRDQNGIIPKDLT